MPFDGIVTSALTNELNTVLKGGKIDKIYQPLKDELFFRINSNRENYTLFISSNSGNPRMYITDEKSQNPITPSPFSMLLRKHLVGGRINEVIQHGSDRVIEFHITGSNELSVKESKKLIIEIMGKHSNVILVNGESGQIIDAIKHVHPDMSRERQILPKLEYSYPPTQGKLPFYVLRKDEFDINNIQGLSKVAKNEVLQSTSPYRKLSSMIANLEKKDIKPVIYYDNSGMAVDFYVFPLDLYAGVKVRRFDSVSSMLNSYYSTKGSSNRMNQKSSDMQKTLKQNLDKLFLKKQRLLEDLEKAKKGDTYKLYGEMLIANLHNIKKGEEAVTLTDYYSNNDITIRMDPLLSPSENAQAYYKKYNKSKTALDEKNKQLKDTEDSISLLESYVTYIDNAETPEDIDDIRSELTDLGYMRKRKNQPAKKNKKTSFLQFKINDDFIVKVGRNNKENDDLTMKTAESHDIWFHTKDIPGSHVILFTNKRHIDEKTILEAASIAAYYSKARESQNVPVDFTKVKHVKKPSGAKPGMVIFKDNRTVYVNPQKPKN